MLDVPAYRAAESAAKATLPSWRAMQMHHLGAFQAVGFPVRVESLTELGMLLDTMQEDRAAFYRREIGAMTGDECEMLASAQRDQAEFAGAFFPDRPPAPADDTMVAMFALYRKLARAAPGFKRVLEIGPGCGYLSFFLKRHAGLEECAQIEAAESFYLLQHLVNLHCFGSAARTTTRHVPWWSIGELQGRRYDVVTANACLLECTRPALEQYLTLAAAVLSPGGKFVAQCFGSFAYGDQNTLCEAMKRHGFRLVSLLEPNQDRCVYNGVWARG